MNSMAENYFSKTRLDGRLIVVSGGAGLIGGEIVKCLCAHGADVVIVDLATERANKIAIDAPMMGGSCRFYECNLAEVS